MKKFSYLLSAMLICISCLFGCNEADGNVERVNKNEQVQEQGKEDKVQEQGKEDEVQEQGDNNVNFNDIVNNGNRDSHNQGEDVDDDVSSDVVQRDYQALADNYSSFLDSLLQDVDDGYQIYGEYEWEVEIGYDEYWENDYASVYVSIYLDSDEGWDEGYIYDENYLPMETLLRLMEDELETNYNINYSDYYIGMDVYLDETYVDCYDHEGWYWDDYYIDIAGDDYQALTDNYSSFLDSLLQEVDDGYQIYGDYEWEVEIGYDEYWECDYADVYVAIYLDSGQGWNEDYIYDEDYLPMESLLLMMQDELETNYNIGYSDYWITLDIYLDGLYVDSYVG